MCLAVGLPIPGDTEGVGRYVGAFITLEHRVHGVAEVNAEVAISGLEQEVGSDGTYIHAFAHGLLLAAVYVAEGLHAVAYLKFGTEVKEYKALVPTLLPLKLYGDAEEEMAQAAVAVVGG